MPDQSKTAQQLRASFNTLLADLLQATGASRTTLRIDMPEIGFHVDDPAGEARNPGDTDVPALTGQTALDQRALDTVRWLDQNRRNLVQNFCQGAVPSPPQALIDIYGVKAQMLGPVIVDDALVGWISVHENRRVREWNAAEVSALDAAIAQVHAALAAASS